MEIILAGKQLFWSAVAIFVLSVGLPIPGRAQVTQPVPATVPSDAPSSSALLKKLSAADKGRIFGTPQTWQQKYDMRFATAPTEIQQRILKERADIEARKKGTLLDTRLCPAPQRKR